MELVSVMEWGFLTKHGRALVCIASDPEVRLRDIASSLEITERHAHGIVSDLTNAGYVLKMKEGRRNRYQVEMHMPMPDPTDRQLVVGDLLKLLTGPEGRRRPATS